MRAGSVLARASRLGIAVTRETWIAYLERKRSIREDLASMTEAQQEAALRDSFDFAVADAAREESMPRRARGA